MDLKEYRQEVYNVLSSLQTTDNIQWIGQKEFNEFPLVTYARFDISTEYSFGLTLESLSYYTEIRVYSDDIDEIDNIVDEIITLMTFSGYMVQTSPAEFLDEDAGVNVSIIRFYKV